MDTEQRPTTSRTAEPTSTASNYGSHEAAAGSMIHSFGSNHGGGGGTSSLVPASAIIRAVSHASNTASANNNFTGPFSHAPPSGTFPDMVMKKKRGRPRKYGPDSRLALTVAPTSNPPVVPYSFSPNSEKRGRGRPPGSGKNQQLAALGELMLGSIGVGFTPHAITIAAGEDIASRIMSFSQQGPRGVCILSANGAISNVTLRQTSISGGAVTYEGRFEILSVSGSFLVTECGDGTRSRTGGLSVSLAGPDGRVIGGSVAGALIAATPVQIVVGSFLNTFKKFQSKPTKLPPSPSLISRPLGDLSKGFNTDGDKPMNDVEAGGPSLHHGIEGAISSNSDSSKEYNAD